MDTASSPQVLTYLPPTVTSRASITSCEVHRLPVSTIRSSDTLHKHPTPYEYWPLSGTTVPHEVSERSTLCPEKQTVIHEMSEHSIPCSVSLRNPSKGGRHCSMRCKDELSCIHNTSRGTAKIAPPPSLIETLHKVTTTVLQEFIGY